MYICTQCDKSFNRFKQLRGHWMTCITPPAAQDQPLQRPINPLNNMWLNDGPLADQDSSCGQAGGDQSTCFQQACVVQSDQNKIILVLLESVEKLTDMILGERPIPSNCTVPPPVSPKIPPSSSTPNHCISGELSDGEWRTVPGKPKPATKTVKIRNMHDILDAIPPASNDTSMAEIPKKTWANSPTQTRWPKKQQQRPQVIINNNPEADHPEWRKTVPGNNSFSGAVKHGKRVALFSDSICNRMSKHQLCTTLKCNVNKKAFPGATTDDLSEHYMMPTLKKNPPDTAIIHIGVNDILEKGTVDGGLTSNAIEQVARDIVKCGEVCRSRGVNTICISSVLPFKGRRAQSTVNNINFNLAKLCREKSFDFILNDNIIYENCKTEHLLFYSDGVHLNDLGRDILMGNFNNYINRD